MKWRNLLSIVIFLTGSVVSFSQSNLLNARTPDQIGIKNESQDLSDNDKPLPYGYVDDRDILMGKKVWEIIDLNERVNFPFYFPVDTMNIGRDRRSLYDVLSSGIKSGKIKEVYSDSYFTSKKSFEDIKASLSKIDTTDAGREQFNSGEKISEDYIVRRDLTSQDITAYKIVGYWYFDKRQGELKYRLLGIAPVAPDVYTIDNDEKDYVELFWIFYPDARELLHKAKAFNDRNSSMPFSFDHMLNSRRFNAVIYREENVYGDRNIEDYIRDDAQMQLLESERIKNKIRDFEQDMWNY